MCGAALRGKKCRIWWSRGYHNAAVPGTDDPGLPTTGCGSHPGCLTAATFARRRKHYRALALCFGAVCINHRLMPGELSCK